MQQVHCPQCSHAISISEPAAVVTCAACGKSFDPMYPFGRPQHAQPQPQHAQPQPQYAQSPQYAAPGQWAQNYPPQYPPQHRKKGMPAWAITLLIVVPAVLLGSLAYWAAQGEPDAQESGPVGIRDKSIPIAREPDPLLIQPQGHRSIFQGQLLQLVFRAEGGTAPHVWRIEGVGDDWTSQVSESRDLSSRSVFSVSGRFHTVGKKTLKATVVDTEGETAWASMEVTVTEWPDSFGTVAISGGYGRREPPWVNGDSFETYPGVHFNFEALTLCSEVTGVIESAELSWDSSAVGDRLTAEATHNRLEFSGRIDELGEWEFSVDADIHLRGFEDVKHRSKKFKLVVLRPPESVWPKKPGELRVLDPAISKGHPYQAGITLNPPKYPYGYGAWPATVEWSWTGDLPPGMEAVTTDLEWMATGIATASGVYTVEIKGVVRLSWIEEPYEISYMLDIYVS